VNIAGVVPFLDEEEHLGALLESLEAQTRPLDRLVLVDDGSRDASPQIAEAFASRFANTSVLHRPVRPVERDRLVGASELSAFQWAVESLEEGWDVVGKLDADLRLTPRTLEAIDDAFTSDPRLGMAGAHLSERGPDGSSVRLRCRPEHVHGATSFYRGECYRQIAPLPAILGWDMIDAPRARMHGWRTASIAVPSGDPLHLRPMGDRDGLLRAYRRWGSAAYALGEHPLHVLGLGLRYMRSPPVGAGGASYLLGWCSASLRRAPRAEPELRAFVRRDQLRRIRRRLVR
jgi:glycosyltransferase involved in cell wall biosynthesis